MVARPDTSFRRWKARTKNKLTPAQHSIPILLIHSSGDQLIPIAHSRQIAAEAKAYGVPLETYFIDDAPHCGAYDHNPQEYHKAIFNFLSRHLEDDLPPQHHAIL
jgi:dipeptidyl aminopeptidase/acylaminoacyl peptidase